MADDIDVAELEAWAAGLAEIQARIAPRFARSEPRARVAGYLRGLLAPLERKNGWTLAERAGEASPDGMQRLLASADWDADAVRDDLRGYVVEHLGDPAGVLVVDETGFLKKGNRSAGVARQYSGTAGRVENCQIGVFLGYAARAGRTLVDRELYLPQAWTDDRDRCAQAGVPAAVGFATKPELAIGMLARALDAGVPVGWVTADEVYGQHTRLRRFLEDRGTPYVLAIPTSHRLWADTDHGPAQRRADRLAAALPAQAWKRISAGAGAKGPRVSWWARVPIRPVRDPGDGFWLLARRGRTDPTDPTDRAYYACHGPAGTPLRELARVAGARWAIEECFQSAKGETGLDQYQVRRYDSWYRHVTLAMFAHAFLTVTRAAAAKKGHTVPPASCFRPPSRNCAACSPA